MRFTADTATDTSAVAPVALRCVSELVDVPVQISALLGVKTSCTSKVFQAWLGEASSWALIFTPAKCSTVHKCKRRPVPVLASVTLL